MAILERDLLPVTEPPFADPHRHLFTRDEFYALADVDAFRDKRMELIEGEIIDMAPIGPSHAGVTHPLAVILERAFGSGFAARNQVPIRLGQDPTPSDPQPDVTVIVGSWRDYIGRHPGPADIKLIVEIADSSLEFDRKVKGRLYAAAGIAEYWILNLRDKQLEVYRDPGGSGYRTTMVYRAPESVEPLFAPGKSIRIAEFMP